MMLLKRFVNAVRRFAAVPADNPDLVKAQYQAFTKQIPLLYAILLSNTWIVAISFSNVAPRWLTAYYPGILTLICGARLTMWWCTRHANMSAAVAAAALSRTTKLAMILTATFLAWVFMLFPYGDPYQQGQLAFYIGITVMGCIFCLMHLRPAAFGVALIGNIAFVAFFSSTGNPVFVAMSVNVALVSVSMLTILMIYYRDFTSMIASQASTLALSNENFRLANLDALTELPNRRKFFSQLDLEFARAAAAGSRLAVGVLDLNGFKPINDLYGHAKGDALLSHIGQRLKELCPKGGHLARLGGDEFALIIAAPGTDADLMTFGESICDALREPIVLNGTTVQVSAALGFAVYPATANDPAMLYERADYALYQSKRARDGKPTLFSADHDAALFRDAGIEQALHAADLDREFSVVFQPIVDLASRRTIGMEALARWHSPTLGQVSPVHFIPVAERIGLVTDLTCILLKKALAAAAHWPAYVRLSFNLSAKDISSADAILRIIGTISRSGAEASRLDMEITETAVMNDFAQASASVVMLRRIGCGISLDDFGTGYSSLTQLHSLPLTKIKIDRTFVKDLPMNPASYKIVKSLIALSRDMDLGCIVEGVETEAEVATLRGLGCQLAQGNRFWPPMPEQLARSLLLNSPAKASA